MSGRADPGRVALRGGGIVVLMMSVWCAASTRDHVDDAASPWVDGASASRLIDVNRATSGELELLPGIGPGLAARIIEDRTARGAFGSIADLERVRGIGPRTVLRFEHVAVAR